MSLLKKNAIKGYKTKGKKQRMKEKKNHFSYNLPHIEDFEI